MNLTPVKPDIGAEISGVSGHDFVEPDVAVGCQRALDAHGVLVFRGADIDDDDLIGLSRLLGTPHVWDNAADPDRPELSVVSLDPAKSPVAAVQRGTFVWHIDGTMSDHPHRLTLLNCREPANDGSGDTEFANTYAAYDALADDEKAEIADLEVHYS